MLSRILLSALAVIFVTPQASAQLDFPSAPAKVPKRPPAAREGEPDRSGAEAEGGLSLPSGPAETLREGSSGDAAEGAGAESGARGPHELFEEKTADRSLGLEEMTEALGEVRGFGAEGLEEARRRLASDRPAVLFLALRSLLEFGTPEDRKLVEKRIRQRVPARACVAALEAFVESDPVLAGPSFMVEMLDHPQSAVRGAAARLLRTRLEPATLPLLVGALDSRRSDTRTLVLELANEIDDPAVVHLMVEHLSDPNAKVANRAATLLAALWKEAPAESWEELVKIAVRDTSAEPAAEVRRSAYAVLALVELEDVHGVRALGTEHTRPLQDALRSSHAVRAGSAAIALTSIGFRSEDVDGTGWMNLEIPHRLVRVVSGADFHSDFTSLVQPATRRLALISGENFGDDGRAWQSWWARSASGFHARRAAMRVGPSDVPTVDVSVSGPDVGRFRLLGPAASTTEAEIGAEGEAFYLDERGSVELVEMLRREGVFGVEHLPGRRGSELGSRRLTVTISGQRKSFQFGPQVEEPWFEHALVFAAGMRDKNLWQRFRDAERHGSRLEHWRAGLSKWRELASSEAAEAHLTQQILTHLRSVPIDRREVGLTELERLYIEEGAARSEDFPALIELLRDERFLASQARRWIDLCVWAGSADHADPEAMEEPADLQLGQGRRPRRIGPTEGRILAEALIDTFGSTCAEELAWVLAASGGASAREAAKDSRAFVRAVASSALAANGEPESVLALRLLLDDPSPDVRAAAVYAAGYERMEGLREEVLERAAESTPVVRASALRSAARFGGVGVKELLLAASADTNPELRRAAIDGLAELGDPSTAPYLVSIFGRGHQDEHYEQARQGLRKMGDKAWSELLRIAHSGTLIQRRDAALLLSEQSVPQVTSTMIGILTETPEDVRIAQELAVLTCIDLRDRSEPANAWWEWWDLVVHDDSIAWFRTALERLGIAAPPADALLGEGDRETALLLLEVVERPEEYIAERSRRELERLLEIPLGAIPVTSDNRRAWLEALRAQIDRRYPE